MELINSRFKGDYLVVRLSSAYLDSVSGRAQCSAHSVSIMSIVADYLKPGN